MNYIIAEWQCNRKNHKSTLTDVLLSGAPWPSIEHAHPACPAPLDDAGYAQESVWSRTRAAKLQAMTTDLLYLQLNHTMTTLRILYQSWP
jgi:hypothetical protein